MFESFSRSWEITKVCFSVLLQDKELILFPLLAGVFSFIFFIIMVFPFIATGIVSAFFGEALGGILELVAVFVFYLGVAFIATFFNTCVVYTIKKRFEGGNATFFESIGFALSKIHLILAWSLVSATVGLILNMLSNFAEKLGPIGKLVMNIVISIIGGVWGVITIFVVPAMVYDNVGPISAIKSSVQTLRKTWGESLIRHIGLGLVQGILFAVGLVAFIVMIFISIITIPLLLVPVFLLFIFYCIVLGLLFGVLNTIFNTALFVYARTGTVPNGYSPEVMQSAFKQQEKKKGLF
jgi:hypothetical protein